MPGAQVSKFALRGKRRIVARLLEPAESTSCVVVYCPSELEGGAGALECLPLCPELLPLGIAVMAIDVTCTGQSLVSPDDVALVVESLRAGLPDAPRYDRVALWARSGGVAAALVAAQDPQTAALVADAAAPAAWGLVARYGDPLKLVQTCFVPGMFLQPGDDLIPADAAKQLRSSYGGEAQVLKMDCAHHAARPNEAVAKAALFLARAFGLEGLPVSQLDADLTRLKAPDPGKKIEHRALELLRSSEASERRWGLFMKAVNACPSYHDVAFNQVLAKGRQRADGLNYAIVLKLPSTECEVCVAWASECASRGQVHFLVISSASISFTRAEIGADQRVILEDLAVQDRTSMHFLSFSHLVIVGV